MWMMILGLTLWTVVHWTPSLTPGFKQRWRKILGPGGYQGSFALLILIGLLLLVLGWRNTPAEHLYQPTSCVGPWRT